MPGYKRKCFEYIKWQKSEYLLNKQSGFIKYDSGLCFAKTKLSSNLSGGDLSDSDLTYTCLAGALIQGINFKNTKLIRADPNLTNTIIKNTRFSNATPEQYLQMQDLIMLLLPMHVDHDGFIRIIKNKFV